MYLNSVAFLGPFAEGDGIKVAEAINASVIHMDQVQVFLHPHYSISDYQTT